ncbi:hypothetical protein RHMOL_Rhmol12G0072800 [Rhododendron molle]|uniref:Uncharacterized protein n=1 Tax=Rhododendron molle TaxID=49168 RepID=A0ACC0LF95_RHOML|nr:hypothetical protein RHMOL_Rhmol12G0072800 [Rhododendron molle]
MMEMGGAGSAQKKRTMSCPTPDIISNLPCNVLEKILVYLTIQDAGRTSVLSRKWRAICIRMPLGAELTVALKGSRNQLGFNEGEISNSAMLLCSIPVVESLVLDYPYVKAFHSATAAIDPVVELFDLEGWSDVSLNELWFVWMVEVSGTKVEMEFIRLLLALSPMLETMDIKLKSKVVAERLRIVEELRGFRRASAQAIITFPK